MNTVLLIQRSRVDSSGRRVASLDIDGVIKVDHHLFFRVIQTFKRKKNIHDVFLCRLNELNNKALTRPLIYRFGR